MRLRARQKFVAALGFVLVFVPIAAADDHKDELFSTCMRDELVSSLQPKARSWAFAAMLQAGVAGAAALAGQTLQPKPSPEPSSLQTDDATKTPEQRELETGKSLKSESQVIADAQYDLRYWKANRAARPDMGSFCIDSELLDLNPQEAWTERKIANEAQQARVARIRKIAGGKALGMPGIQSIRAYLIQDAMPIFKRNDARMIDFDLDAGGNAEAETKLVISALTDSGIELQPPLRLGIQNFSDQIHPVIWDSEKNTVYDLLSGKTVQGVQGNIYAPELIQYAFLEGRNKTPDADLDQDLLIAKEDAALVHHLRAGRPRDNSKSKWPEASGVWTDGKSPPLMRVLGLAAGEGRGEGDSPDGPPPPAMDVCPSDLRDWDGKKVEMTENTLPYEVIQVWTSQDIRSVLVCVDSKDPKFLKDYRQLKSRTDRVNYMQQVTQQMFLDLSNTPGFKTLTAFLMDPSRAPTMSAEDFRQAVAAEKQIADIRDSAGAYLESYGKAFVGLDDIYLYPVFKTFSNDARLFGQKLAENPRSWLAWVDALPKEQQLGVFSVISHFETVYNHGEIEGYKSFLNWASKPGNIEVITDSQAAQSRPIQLQALAQIDQEKSADSQIPVLLWFDRGKKTDALQDHTQAFVSSPFLGPRKEGSDSRIPAQPTPTKIKISETTLERLSTSFFDEDARPDDQRPKDEWKQQARMFLRLMKLWNPAVVQKFISDRSYISGLDEAHKGPHSDWGEFVFGPKMFGYFEDNLGSSEVARAMSGINTVQVVHDSAYKPTDFDNRGPGYDHSHVLAKGYPAFLEPIINEMNQGRAKSDQYGISP